MKIRTGFVTNSSSYCSAEVVIDNPVLLGILKKYKDNVRVLDFFNLDDKVGFREDENGGRPFADNCPTKLEEVVQCIMNAIDELSWDDIYYDMDEEDYNADQNASNMLISELRQKKAEIEKSFKSIEWQYSDKSYGEFGNIGSAKYAFCDGKETYEEMKSTDDEDNCE